MKYFYLLFLKFVFSFDQDDQEELLSRYNKKNSPKNAGTNRTVRYNLNEIV